MAGRGKGVEMLPEIEIETGATMNSHAGVSAPAPLRFRINGHRFQFEGTAAEIYTIRRDLEDARRYINAARNLEQTLNCATSSGRTS
jgi:hypothetical protein